MGKESSSAESGSPVAPASPESHQEGLTASTSKDVVDTQWDIPFIDFSSVSKGTGSSVLPDRTRRKSAGAKPYRRETSGQIPEGAFGDVHRISTGAKGLPSPSGQRTAPVDMDDFWALFADGVLSDTSSAAGTAASSRSGSSVGSAPGTHVDASPEPTTAMPPLPPAASSRTMNELGRDESGQGTDLAPSVRRGRVPARPLQTLGETSGTRVQVARHRHAHTDHTSAAAEIRAAKRYRLRKIVTLILVVVVIAALAIGGALFGIRHHRAVAHATAMERCTTSLTQYRSRKTSLTKALTSADSATGVTVSQVSDAATVEKLDSVVSSARALAAGRTCSSGMTAMALSSVAQTNLSLASKAEKLTTSVRSASAAVLKSQRTKTEAVRKAQKDQAKAALSTTVSSGTTLLTNSRWKVADDSTRVTLQTALSDANTVLADDKSDVAAYESAKVAITTAMTKVTASMQTLTEQEAAQAASSASATSSSGADSSPSPSTGSSTKSSS
ncbi:hypothetical protein [uncultured Bifidobacterium sp.]|uniref:hypothetical protein n=1 Tax=uncultured Bifidobacterium sp. TaxID=165187 RepID=UPI0028DAF8CF|nr:hypothetical protein [uncultured Bifidobacterium sp.]